eukprot:scpid112729/ scgid34104/ 
MKVSLNTRTRMLLRCQTPRTCMYPSGGDVDNVDSFSHFTSAITSSGSAADSHIAPSPVSSYSVCVWMHVHVCMFLKPYTDVCVCPCVCMFLFISACVCMCVL